MAKEVLHVVPQNGAWAVKYEKSNSTATNHDTQRDGIESARNLAKDGDEIVIHRPDGTIRERITYSDPDTKSVNRGSQPEAPSVGTRINWGAIVAGALVALAINAALIAFAVAIGLTTINDLRAETVIVTAAITTLVTTVLSLFIGGLVSTRATTGEDSEDAVIYGVLVWATTSAAVLITGAGFGMGAGLLATDVSREVSRVDTLVADLDLTPEQKEKVEEAKNRSARMAGAIDARTAAWLSFAGLALSIASAIGGAFVGNADERRYRESVRNSRLPARAA